MNREQLRKDLKYVINKNSAESGSDTPDFILADYLMNCLDSFNNAVRQREGWYSKDKADTQIELDESVQAGNVESSDGCQPTSGEIAYENIPEAIEHNAKNDQLAKIMLLRGNDRQIAEALEYIKVDGRFTKPVKPEEPIFTEDEIAIIKKVVEKFKRSRKLGPI